MARFLIYIQVADSQHYEISATDDCKVGLSFGDTRGDHRGRLHPADAQDPLWQEFAAR